MTYAADKPEGRRHFYSLDALRGLAAIGVVFWHWQHFFFVGTREASFDTSRQPFYFLLKPFYLEGWRAVELFFSLSGFIFFWLYSEKIAARKTSPREFVVFRFSRLYPLHFLTLILVAAGQYIMWCRFGSFFVYPYNDWYHFFLQLFLASNWGFERSYSFNGPIWSVSVEVFLYIIFFLVCFLKRNRWWHLILFIYLGHFLLRLDLKELSQGMVSFFSGGLSYQLFLYLLRRGLSIRVVSGMIFLTMLMWALVPMGFAEASGGGSFTLHHGLWGHLFSRAMESVYEIVLFPTTILTLALTETFRGTLGKRLSILGNISYSIYLLHFPLQLLFVTVALEFAAPNRIFYSPWTMLLFFVILIPLSLGSYHYWEKPCQKSLRSRLL